MLQHEEDTRYARADGIDRWLEREDDQLDRAVAEKLRRAGRLDALVRTIALAPSTDPFSDSMMVAAASIAYDAARRMWGVPELCVANQRVRTEFPFATLAAALDCPKPVIGCGSLTVPSVQDRDEDIQMRRLYNTYGIETTPAKGTRPAPDGDPRGLRLLQLRLSVESAIEVANPDAVHPNALEWVYQVTVGFLRRVPRSRRKGPTHTLELARAFVDDRVIDGTREPGIATRFGESVNVVRTAIRIARGRIVDELVRSELLAPQKPRRRRPQTTAFAAAPVFGGF